MSVYLPACLSLPCNFIRHLLPSFISFLLLFFCILFIGSAPSSAPHLLTRLLFPIACIIFLPRPSLSDLPPLLPHIFLFLFLLFRAHALIPPPDHTFFSSLPVLHFFFVFFFIHFLVYFVAQLIIFLYLISWSSSLSHFYIFFFINGNADSFHALNHIISSFLLFSFFVWGMWLSFFLYFFVPCPSPNLLSPSLNYILLIYRISIIFIKGSLSTKTFTFDGIKIVAAEGFIRGYYGYPTGLCTIP